MCVSLIGRALCYGHKGTGSNLVHAFLLTLLSVLRKYIHYKLLII